MDIISLLFGAYREAAYALPSPIYSFLLRANIILLIPTLIAYAGFSKGLRNTTVQTLLIILGILAGLSLPIENYVSTNSWRPWLVALLLLGLIYLPSAISYLAEPRLGYQLKLRRRIKVGLFLLFLINLIWS